MNKLLCFLFILISYIGIGQTVSVNQNNSAQNLANILLNNACVEVSNTSVSSLQSVSYFNNNSGSFPIAEGVIIRNGNTSYTAGSYTGNNLSSQENSNTDSFLEGLNNASGQTSKITDVAYLEFEFIPLSKHFSFDFLFASNEYGQWQCVSSDVFAFLLTDLSTGQTTNLAVIPGTQTPVSVKNIKDSTYNNSCSSDNASLFDVYNVINSSQSTINMRGHTKMMNASAKITPGNPYKIKLVIGDSNDSDFDSAIFLAAGSFNANVDLGKDTTICQGSSKTITTGLSTQNYSHIWKMNGFLIPGQNGNSITVTNPGNYSVLVLDNNSSCSLTDEIILTEVALQEPKDIKVCHDPSGNYSFNLLENSYKDLGVSAAAYSINYYASQQELFIDNAIAVNQLSNYSGQGNQTIYIKLKAVDTNMYCDVVYSFQLLINDPIYLNTNHIELCDMTDANHIVDLNQNNSTTIFGSSGYNFYFFHNYFDAQTNSNAILDPENFTPVFSRFKTKKQTIWVRVEDKNMTNCFNISSFDIILNPLPIVDEIADVVECSQYTLPPIINGNYYTGSQGTGAMLFAGDIVKHPGTYYIYNGPDVNGCYNESKFKIILIEKYSVRKLWCGQMTVPSPPAGAFYTEPGGPNGNGQVISPGTVFTTNQTLYFYADVNGVFCKEDVFPINILPLPPVDAPLDVVTCNSYTLPTLQNGNYYSESDGEGTQYSAGDVISSSQTMYVFNYDGFCTNENSFEIIITPNFQDLNICGTYTLPDLEIGGYYTQAGGNGQVIPEGQVISSSQTIYYYAITTTSPNCTLNEGFFIEINSIPEVDSLNDVMVCEDDIFTLPNLVNGQYFSAPDREGDQLFEGDVVNETSTIYINNLANGCTNETSFLVEIIELPPIENFTDVYSCEAYELPPLANSNYFTQPYGGGQQLQPGDLITNTQEIYIYNFWPQINSCDNQDSFTVYIEGVEVGVFDNIQACDNYTLPPLNEGKYFTQSGGQGEMLQPGALVSTSQEIFVYAVSGDRFTCESEASFQINISQTPNLQEFENIEACGSYNLSMINIENAEVKFYRSSNQQGLLTQEDLLFNEPGTYIVYVYAVAEANTKCTIEKAIEITVHPLLSLNIEEATICKDPKTEEIISPAFLSSGLPDSEFEVNWYLDGNLMHTGENFEATEAGIYTVKSTVLNPISTSDCGYEITLVTVTESSKPIIETLVTEPFEDVAVINVIVKDAIGELEYQLNNGIFQESNEFYDVNPGVHTVRVRGMKGYCGEAIQEVEVIKYPKFFTPNADGVNDEWNIKDLKEHPEAQVYIFDRFGKLITTLSPRKRGWDGSLNGKNLPSNDYWFQVVFKQDGNEKVFKSHFTLKR